MKRRSFLAALGLAPVAAASAVASVAIPGASTVSKEADLDTESVAVGRHRISSHDGRLVMTIDGMEHHELQKKLVADAVRDAQRRGFL